MKLAFCLFKYFPYGGLQRDFLRIARECHQRGHDIHIYTTTWEGEREPGFHLHIIPVNRWTNHGHNRSFVDKTKLELMAGNYDLVIGFNMMPYLDIYYAADVCYEARIVRQRGLLYRLLPRYQCLRSFEQEVFAKGHGTEIMLISPIQKNEFTKYYHTELKRLHLMPPGISPDRIAPPNAAEIRARKRAQNHLSDHHIMLLMVGSSFKTKGLDRSLRALAALPPALSARTQLFVIGQDDPTPYIRLARHLNVDQQIHFLSGRSDVLDFMLAADLLLHPSYHENTGTVLLEALAAGLPVLTLDVCGYAHFVSAAKAGEVLASPFNQGHFNASLQKMLLSSDLQQMQQNGLAYAKSADIYSMPQKAADLIEKQGKRQKSNIIDLSFDQMMSLRGEKYRHQEGRLTQRVVLDGESYFIKQHTGVGWKEIFKNIFQLRLPVISAQNEWLAIKKLQTLGVNTADLIAYGRRGLNPARVRSYVLMNEVAPAISLEDFCKTWQKRPPEFTFKCRIISEVAKIARTLHENGMNHRDLYLCHFLLDMSKQNIPADATNLKLYLIDLHRVQMRRLTPERWIIKDLAGLYFSSKDIGLTRRDLFRFMKKYKQQSLREIFSNKTELWQRVRTRGEELYRDHKE